MKRITCVFLCVALAASVSRADTLYWDGDGDGASGDPPTGVGGHGTWDTGTMTNWWNGTSYQLWNEPGGLDIADFRGTAGTVSIDGTVNATKLDFHTDGYVLTNGTLNLTGTKTIEVGAGLTTTIGSSITTSTAGWTKQGVDGKLILTGDSSYTGWLSVYGTLNVRSSGALGAEGADRVIDIYSGASNKGVLELEGGVDIGNIPVWFIRTGPGLLRNVSGTNSLGGLVRYNVDTVVESQAGLLTLGGGLERGAADRLITVQGAGDVLINSGWMNATRLTKNDAGTLTLSGTNRFSSLSNITGGSVLLQGENTFAGVTLNATTTDPAIGTRVRVNDSITVTNGNLLVQANAALELEDLGGSGLHLAPASMTISGAGIADSGAIRNIAGTNSITVGPAIGSGGPSNRINSDAGRLTLNGDINWTGGTRNWAFGGAGELVINGTIASGITSVNKDGSGLVVMMQQNLYGTATTVFEGALRLEHAFALPGGTGASGGTGRLDLNGGVVELAAGNFERGLGIGVSQFRFLGSGGFSAYGANRHVNIGGAGAGVTWATVNFVPVGSALMLNSSYANAQIDFQNPINLNGAARTIYVADNPNSDNDIALMSGILSGTGQSGLVKTGAGGLILSADNTYQGATLVNEGLLLVTGSIAGSGVTVADTGVLGGTGSVDDVLVESGGALSPGLRNSTGDLTVGNLTLNGGSIIHWDIEDTDNFDRIVSAAILSLNATAEDRVVIHIRGLAADVAEGMSFALYTGSISPGDFDADKFELVNESGWSPGWKVEEGSLILKAIPEPGAMGLLGFGAALVALLRRRANVE